MQNFVHRVAGVMPVFSTNEPEVAMGCSVSGWWTCRVDVGPAQAADLVPVLFAPVVKAWAFS